MTRTIILTLVLTAVCFSFGWADDELSEERQLEIIYNYMLVSRQADGLPAKSLAEFDDATYDRPVKCGTPAILDFVFNYDRLDRSLLKSLGVELAQRPTGLSDSLDTPSDIFRIHYTTEGRDAIYQPNVDNNSNGIPDMIDRTAEIMDSVYSYIVDTLGYPPPPQDGYEPGGDEKYDVYLIDLGAAFYGQTWADSLSYHGLQGVTATSYLELNADPSQLYGYEDNPLDAIRVTCAHEFFHSVQFGIDVTEAEGVLGDDFARRYWMEMSAVWMEEEQYDEIDDYLGYLKSFFDASTASLQRFNSLVDQYPYGASVFAIYLSQKFGRDIIKDIWMRCGSMGRGPSFLEAASLLIDSASGGTMTWSSALQEFGFWMYLTGERSDLNIHGSRLSFWECTDGAFPACNDSALVVDTSLGYDRVHLDTVYFEGFEERLNYPMIPDENFQTFRSYPVTMFGSSNPLSPEINGLGFVKLEEVMNIAFDTTYWICEDGAFPNCLDSSESDQTVYDIMHVDSMFSFYLALGDGPDDTASSVYNIPTLAQGWGLTVIYQMDINPDSFIVETYTIRDDFSTLLALPNPSDYRSLTMALTPTSSSRAYYDEPTRRTMRLGLLVQESGRLDSALINIPAAVLRPYPNPVVTMEMNDPRVTFRFQVPTDSTSFPVYDDPYLVVDVFNIAGELVNTIEGITWRDARLGLFKNEWDLKNRSGRQIASGVYIAYARLFSDSRKGTLLAEDKSKIAVIR